MKYTKMELEVIKAIGEVLNYDTLEANIEDNATGLEIKETCEITGLEAKQVRAIFSSLEQKGLMYLEEINMGHTRYMQITELGLREYFALFVNNDETTNTQESKEDSTMVKVIERNTNAAFAAEKIDGGYKIFSMSGELYKKVKDSTFKKYFKLTGDTVEKPQAEAKTEDKVEAKSTKKTQKTEAHKELSPEEKDKMIAKIKKILALAEENPSIEEGLSAALQAQKLMAKYNIHKEDVELEEVKEDIVSVFIDRVGKNVLMAWRKQLALIVGKNFRCKVYMSGNAVAFRGYREDTKIAEEVFKSLYLIGTKLARKQEAAARKDNGTAQGIFNTYIAGFLREIDEGMGEQCTALMVVVPKEVEEEYKEFSANFGKTNTKAFKVIDSSIYNKGREDGKAAVKARQVEKKGEKENNMKEFKCCICGTTVTGWGNDPWPVVKDEDAECCDYCNMSVVVPARIKLTNNKKEVK